MEKKNKSLFLILLILIGANVAFFFTPKGGGALSFDADQFRLLDTASVQSVEMSGEHQVVLTRSKGGWQVNQRYLVDESLRSLLFSILMNVEVKRPVSIQKNSVGVKVVLAGQSPVSFTVYGNATKTRTYFEKNGQTYEVEIPGYRDYLGTIFNLHPDQWRDRLVLDGSWRTIQELKLDYLSDAKKDFSIRFQEDFFVVDGVHQLDSNFVVEYLNQFQNWQTNEWVSKGRFPQYDLLMEKSPLATLTIESLGLAKPQTFDIYPQLEGERIRMVVNEAGEMMVFDDRRMAEILISADDFKLSP